MNKIIFTDVTISKGYKDVPALRFNENKTAVRFKIGQRIYDKNAKDNHRYINIAVKAFSPLSERIEKMLLKEGSRINLFGRLDEETWEDKEKGQQVSQFVIIADEIEYASNSSDSNKSNGNNSNGADSVPQTQNGNEQNTASAQTQQNSSEENTEQPANFTGFQNFNTGGENVFF